MGYRSLLFISCCLALLGSACDSAPSSPPSPTSSGGTASAGASSAEASPAGSTAGGASASAASQKPDKKPRNVILLIVDAMRAEMPWQGYDRPIAPHLTKLAEQSVIYPRAYSVSSYTAKSLGALLSSRYPSSLYRGQTFFTKYSKANLFFPEVLQKNGIRTFALQAHGYFDKDKNFRQGVDEWQVLPGLKWNAETDENVTGPQMTEMAIKMLGNDKNTGGQFFFWLHYMDPHDKYVVHEGVPKFGKKARDLYDGEIHFTDTQIRKLLDFCEKQPWWEDTALVITGDHGEAFGEHGQWKHAFALWEVLTRVPLMIHGAGIKPRRIEQRRSHIDLAPTILDMMGVEPPAELVGKSLLPELSGAEPDDREPIMLELPADTYNPPTRAIVAGDFKLIEDPGKKYKLYNLVDDPGEKKNLARVAAHKAKLDELRTLHEKVWAKHEFVAPWGGKKLVGGVKANGPKGPAGWVAPDSEAKK